MSVLISPISINFGDPFLFQNNIDIIDNKCILYNDLWYSNIEIKKKKRKGQSRFFREILRYRLKKKKRIYNRNIYKCRSDFAKKRKRIRGRFVKIH